MPIDEAWNSPLNARTSLTSPALRGFLGLNANRGEAGHVRIGQVGKGEPNQEGFYRAPKIVYVIDEMLIQREDPCSLVRQEVMILSP